MILTKKAVENGVSRASLSQLCKDGKISRVAFGQYVLSDDLNDEILSLGIRSDYIIFSHETALFLNGLSERTPFEHAVTIPSSKTLARSISDGCKIYIISTVMAQITAYRPKKRDFAEVKTDEQVCAVMGMDKRKRKGSL